MMKVFMLKCSVDWEQGYGVVNIYSTKEKASNGMLDHSAKYFLDMNDSWSVDDGQTIYIYVDEEDAYDHRHELSNDPNFKPDWLDNIRYQIVTVEVV